MTVNIANIANLTVLAFSANLFAENSKKIAGKVEKQMTEIKDSISSSHQTNSYWLRTIPTTQYQLIHLPAWRQSNPIPSGQSSKWVQKRGKVGGSWCRWSSCQLRTWYLSPPGASTQPPWDHCDIAPSSLDLCPLRFDQPGNVCANPYGCCSLGWEALGATFPHKSL